jgi:hypothetical protein
MTKTDLIIFLNSTYPKPEEPKGKIRSLMGKLSEKIGWSGNIKKVSVRNLWLIALQDLDIN